MTSHTIVGVNVVVQLTKHMLGKGNVQFSNVVSTFLFAIFSGKSEFKGFILPSVCTVYDNYTLELLNELLDVSMGNNKQ